MRTVEPLYRGPLRIKAQRSVSSVHSFRGYACTQRSVVEAITQRTWHQTTHHMGYAASECEGLEVSW